MAPPVLVDVHEESTLSTRRLLTPYLAQADVRGVGDRLRTAHGVPTVLYVGVAELAQAHIDAAGDLRVGGHAVSLVYSRFDFSHPFGEHQAQAPQP